MAASHHDARRFRIAPDVVFGRGSDVAFAAGRAAHDHTTTHFRGDSRLLLQGERDIRKRAERDHYQAWMRFNCVDDGIGSALPFRSAAWRRVAVIAQARASVNPDGADSRALQWLFRACKYWHFGIAKLRRIDRITGGLMDIHISRNR